MLLTRLKEAVSNVRHYILFLDVFEVSVDFHGQGRAVLPHSHLLFNLVDIFLGATVLLLFEHFDVRSAIPRPHMLNEVGPVADLLAFQSVDEWTVPFVEAVRAANLCGKIQRYVSVIIFQLRTVCSVISAPMAQTN